MRHAFIRWLALPLLLLAPALLIGCEGFTIGDLGSIGLQDESSPEGQKPEVRVALDAPQAFESMDLADKARQRALDTGDGRELLEATRLRPRDYEYKLLWSMFRAADGDEGGARQLRDEATLDYWHTRGAKVGQELEAYERAQRAFLTSVLTSEIDVFYTYKKQGKFLQADNIRRAYCADLETFEGNYGQRPQGRPPCSELR